MGQPTTIDLPDPLDAALPAGPAGSADDLLSQMVGDDVDRLLAEADDDAAPAEPARPKTPQSAPPRAAAVPSESTPDAVNAEPANAESAKPAAPEPAAADIGAELDELLTDLESDRPLEKPRASAGDHEDGGGARVPVEAPPPDAAVEPRTSEKAALLAAAGFETSAVGAGGCVAAADPAGDVDFTGYQFEDVDADDAKLPFYLKPLEWLNAPFANVPEGVRAKLGWVGLLTFVNAAALIAWVMYSKRHHP